MHSDDLIISKADGRPMYLQIMEQIKQRVAVGDWARGAEIPSIRQLAVGLRVSVITVKRAYLELEREGDRKSTRLNSSHTVISYAVFCFKKKILMIKVRRFKLLV